MNAMFNLLLRFWPRRKAGAPAMTPAVAKVRPTNSRRVSVWGEVEVLGVFMG
jgi:hypothetical protein